MYCKYTVLCDIKITDFNFSSLCKKKWEYLSVGCQNKSIVMNDTYQTLIGSSSVFLIYNKIFLIAKEDNMLVRRLFLPVFVCALLFPSGLLAKTITDCTPSTNLTPEEQVKAYIKCLDDKLAHVNVVCKKVSNGDSLPVIQVLDANVHIVSSQVPGSGNLVVGELHSIENASDSFVSGRGNSVAGTQDAQKNDLFTSSNSLIGGVGNRVVQRTSASLGIGTSSPPPTAFISMCGGALNVGIASTDSIVGGSQHNTQGGDPYRRFTSMIGGRNNSTTNTARGGITLTYRSIVGASLVGGDLNSSGASYSSVFGGFFNSINNPVASFESFDPTSSICGGFSNVLSGYFSSIVGGNQNGRGGRLVDGNYAVVSGGMFNAVSRSGPNVGAVVNGGRLNHANDGGYIGGGDANVADRAFSSVMGGRFNRTSGKLSSVYGGRGNDAVGTYSAILGGRENLAHHVEIKEDGDGSSPSTDPSFCGGVVLGGFKNIADGEGSVICGGSKARAKGLLSMVGGGYNNEASGLYSLVTGGENNAAKSSFSSVYGGFKNIVEGSYSCIMGGQDNYIKSTYATILGGSKNKVIFASGKLSAIVGGQNNKASGNHSVVVGGYENHAQGQRATICGGNRNTVDGNGSTVLGGTKNNVDEDFGLICGGKENSVLGNRSNVIRGGCNKSIPSGTGQIK